MAMQTDVLCGHLHQSGFIVAQAPARIKAISIKGSASAGQFDLFSTTTVPVTGTYAQSGTTITVTKSAHGLVTGDRVGITFTEGTGGAGFPGNYTITKLTDNTFTVTSPNSLSVTAGAACVYVSGNLASWLVTFETSAGDTYQNYFLLPGEGIRSLLGTYAYMSNIEVATVFYG
jgi:hypothetical protein